MTGQKHSATGDRLADERSVHAAKSLPKGPETVSLRDELRAVINDLRTEKDKWAGTGAYAPMNAAANRIENTLSLLPPKGWRLVPESDDDDQEA